MITARRLRDTREDHDEYQKQVAAVLKITPQQYQLYESGQRKIPIDKLKIYCEHYNISADYMLGLIKEPKPIR